MDLVRNGADRSAKRFQTRGADPLTGKPATLTFERSRLTRQAELVYVTNPLGRCEQGPLRTQARKDGTWINIYRGHWVPLMFFRVSAVLVATELDPERQVMADRMDVLLAALSGDGIDADARRATVMEAEAILRELV